MHSTSSLPLIITLLAAWIPSVGQEFSFTMHFTDSLGNRDSLEIGYDPLATEELDSIFQEENIVTTPWDALFEVRISSQSRYTEVDNMPEFHTKKQIISKECTGQPREIIEVNIKSDHWPITASWKAELFGDSCTEGSVFTSIHPGGWWDTGSPSDLQRIKMQETDSVTFRAQVYEQDQSINKNYAYTLEDGSVVSAFWIGIGRKHLYLSTTQTHLDRFVHVLPNPTSDRITIQVDPDFQLNTVTVYSLSGQRLIESEATELNLAALDSGIYILIVSDRLGNMIRRKLVKQ